MKARVIFAIIIIGLLLAAILPSGASAYFPYWQSTPTPTPIPPSTTCADGFFVKGSTTNVMSSMILRAEWHDILGADITDLDRAGKSTFLRQLACPEQDYFGWFGHGYNGYIKLSDGSIIWKSNISRALANREPYKLVILIACYGDTVAPTLMKYSQTGTVVLTCHSLGYEEVVVPRINQFISMVNDSANYEVPLYELWLKLGTTPGSSKYEDPIFMGDKTLRVCDIFD